MKQLIYNISNVSYLLFEAELALHQAGNFQKNILKHKGIIQSNRSIKGGILTKTKMRISVLIPEENAVAFSNQK